MRPSSIACLAIALAPSSAEAGFFIEGELGAFATIGGRNTNSVGDADLARGTCRVEEDQREPFPKRALSNLQPVVSLTAGYEVTIGDEVALSGGVRASAAFANGAGRVSDGEYYALLDDPSCLRTISSKSSDYAVYETGAEIEAAFMLTDRIALTIEASGALAVLLPDPRYYADDSRAGGLALAPAVGGALGVQYETLLEELTIGLELRFEMILLEGARIPAISMAVPVRFNLF